MSTAPRPLNNYHVRSPGVRKGRTAIGLDGYIAELLAIHLGCDPDSDDAHATVRRWLHKQVDQNPVRAANETITRFLMRRAVEEIARPELIPLKVKIPKPRREPSSLSGALWDLRAVKSVVTLSTASIYRYMEYGNFPRPVRIGNRRVAWREADIRGWIAARGY